MLSHLVYVSVRKEQCDEKEIKDILAACKRNNRDIDVTGVLLHSPTHFVQYLEGEYKTIYGLYDKIKGDDRHKRVALVSMGAINERIFPSWQMGAREFNAERVTFETELDAMEAGLFQDILDGNQQEQHSAMRVVRKFFNPPVV